MLSDGNDILATLLHPCPSPLPLVYLGTLRAFVCSWAVDLLFVHHQAVLQDELLAALLTLERLGPW